jgi:predicted component of type VI protein secretion system
VAPSSLSLSLEIVEGPGAGRGIELDRPMVVGRDREADLVLDDPHASRRHARVSPEPGEHALVEDLGSSNGTFVNQVQIHAPTRISPGDELLIGISVFALSADDDASRRETAAHVLPPTLASPPRLEQPAYLGEDGRTARVPELERLLDANVRFRARTAPLAVFVLVALIVSVYLGSR